MYKRATCVAMLTVFLVALPKGFAEPRDGWRLEERVPASTLAMVTLEDVGRMGERFEKTAIAGLFREPEMRAFMKPIEKGLQEMVEADEGHGPFGEATPLVIGLFEQLTGLRGQAAVALLDVDLDEEEPRLVASLDFGEHLADFQAFVDRVKTEIDPEGEHIKTFEKDGRTWWQVQDEPRVTATTQDTVFVLATDAGLLESVLAHSGEDTLGTSAHYATVRRKASGGGELGLFAYANVPAIVDLLEPEMGRRGRRIANTLGLDTVQAAAYGMAFVGDGFMDSFVIHTPGADHGIVPLLRMPPYEADALRFAPRSAFWFEEGSLDLANLLPNIRRLGARVDDDFADELNDGLAEMRDALGVDVETEVVAGLEGGLAAYLAMPETGGLYPELALFLKVKDAAAYEDVFARLARGIAGVVSEEGRIIASTRTLAYRDHTLHLFEMQRARGNDIVPFTPTWTLLDDWLVVTLVPHAMKEIVLRTSAGEGEGLAGEEDFASLRRLMPPQAGAMSYLDLKGILSLVYDTGVPLLQTIVKPNVLGRDVPFPLDWAQLPAARTVRPYLRSMATFTTWNADGISIQMHGPIPLAGVIVVAAAVAVPFLAVGGVAHDMAESRAIEVRRLRPGEPRPPTPPIRVKRVEKGEKGGGTAKGRDHGKGMPAKGSSTGPSKGKAKGVAAAAKLRRAHLQVEELCGYVRVFLLTERRLPKDLAELQRAEILPKAPSDPWGHGFRLEIQDEKTRRFSVTSSGPDGKFDTADDIRSGR